MRTFDQAANYNSIIRIISILINVINEANCNGLKWIAEKKVKCIGCMC